LKIPINDSLAGRVARSTQPVFVADLMKEQKKMGVQFSTIGKSKVNLSWMGTPLTSRDALIGVIAVASYKVNAFDQVDFELLQNLAQQASLALDNASHHAEVEAQSRLDSLTKVYNHGYFLEFLRKSAEQASRENDILSLIMLDVDQFKQYNDTYGHLVGDKVLVALTDTIRRHIESTDGVGRWGGEEFAILLLHTNGSQADQIAGRIRETVNALQITNRDGDPVPAPTVSQGIAVYPDETEDIFKLVDLADRRLYVAKEHGRNQVQPDMKHWKSIQSPQEQKRGA
jgi:diguanylate cyclase (GGDEF)-like protein